MTRYLRAARDDGRVLWAEADDDVVHVTGGAPWETTARTGEQLPRRGLALLAPVTPTKIVCVGRNYTKHAAELGNEVPAEPLLFLKPPSSVIGPGAAIVRPRASALVHHEGELAVVMGARVHEASAAEALRAVFGFTCANDVTARDIQRAEGRFTRAKGFDTFCPLGPALVSTEEVEDPQRLSVRVTVDGELRQDGNTAAMVFPIGELLAFISGVMTLEPGDVVLTGTPEGVGPLAAGQRVRVEVGGVGGLENPVRDAGSGSD